MPHAVKCNHFLYADDTCLVWILCPYYDIMSSLQHKDINEIEKQLNQDFGSICDWFVDNKLSSDFGDDKTKSILFANKVTAPQLGAKKRPCHRLSHRLLHRRF